MFAFPTASVAAPAAIVTETVPEDEPLTTSNVYVVPDPAKLLAAGEPPLAEPVTVISPTTKLLTDSLNVAVKLNVVEPVEEPEEPEEDVIATVGEVMSSLSFMNCARALRYPDVITPYRILSMVTISVSIASESSNPFTP